MTAVHDRGVAPLHRASRAVGGAAAIATAQQLGVLAAIEGAPRTAGEIAAGAGIDARRVVLLLDALVDVGIVLRHPDDRYESALPVRSVQTLFDLWGALPGFLAEGTVHNRLDNWDEAGPTYRSLAAALGDVDAATVDRVAAAIGDPGRRVLDLGAGVAVWSRALAARHPAVELTAVDLPAVAAETEVALDAAGLGDRAHVVPGDLFSVTVEGTFDTVIVANVCRLFGEDGVRRLFARAAAWCAPGGRIAVIDVLPDGDRPGDASVGLYALGLAMRTASGGVHSFSAYAAWLYDAGFVRIEVEPLGQPELTLIRAIRPQ